MVPPLRAAAVSGSPHPMYLFRGLKEEGVCPSVTVESGVDVGYPKVAFPRAGLTEAKGREVPPMEASEQPEGRGWGCEI